MAKDMLQPEDPRLGRACAACSEALAVGQVALGVPVGPGKDPVARANAKTGKAFSPAFAIAHRACVTGKLDDED